MNNLQRTHFEWFGLPERFTIDRAALDAAYREIQGAVHPDRFAAGSDAERRVAMQMATQANEAYRTLKDPVRRASYLCERHGVSLEAESNTSMPAAFLLQQMEWRERLDDARRAKASTDLEALRAELGASRDELLEAVRAAIDDRADFVAAASLSRRLMFLERLGSEIDAAEDALLG